VPKALHIHVSFTIATPMATLKGEGEEGPCSFWVGVSDMLTESERMER
jgi:hypothetical protein